MYIRQLCIPKQTSSSCGILLPSRFGPTDILASMKLRRVLKSTMQSSSAVSQEQKPSNKPWMLKHRCSSAALSSLHTLLELSPLVTQILHMACLYEISKQHEVTTC
ncbi:TPA: hypothetical protein ACH3X2_007551 [Trebouxia sp. C0005]